MGKLPNVAVILDILPGTDGEIKMSKSLGNHIPLLASPEDMYGKVMSVPDKAMPYFFRLVTSWKPEEILEVEQDLASGKLHPRDAKMKLAREIVAIYHSEEAARAGEEAFIRVFQKGDIPEEMDVYSLKPGQSVIDVLSESGLVSSTSEGRRMLKQNAVRLDGETLNDPLAAFPGPGVLQVGKRKFVRVV